MKVNETIRQFYRRLNHPPYGLTELVALEKDTGGIIATGFFDNERDFVASSDAYNQRCNLYAGRNPRPASISRIINYMNIVQKKRARDKQIEHITAISLDIGPIRPKGTPATERAHQTAIQFAVKLREDIGGGVDDSGNGAYLWIQFAKPIRMTGENRDAIKAKCWQWQKQIVEKYQPEKYRLRIDGCFDLSRLKRVIGTFNHKAQRRLCFIKSSEANDKIRNQILSIKV